MAFKDRRGDLEQAARALQISLWGVGLMTLIFLVFSVTSSFIAHRDEEEILKESSKCLIQNPWVAFWASCFFFFLGSLLTLITISSRSEGMKENFAYFAVPLRRKSYLFFILASIPLLAIFWLISAHFNNQGWHMVTRDPGGIFAIVMGVVTIVGFALTLHDLRELRRRITTFPDLIDRLSHMLREDSEDDLRFLAYTPALGYIALEDREFEKFFDALHATTEQGKPRVDMTILNKPDLEDWHDSFVGRRTRRKSYEKPNTGNPDGSSAPDKASEKLTNRTVPPEMAKAATEKGEFIVSDFRSHAQHRTSKKPEVKRLPFDFLPGYYFFVNSTRAIVAAPLQLPFPKGAPKQAQKSQSSRTVQMLGLETNDRSIINDLADLYDSYKELPSTYVAETQQVVSAAGLRSWIGRPSASSDNAGVVEPSHFPTCDDAIDEILRQFDVASTGNASNGSEEDKLLRADYQQHFIDLKKTKLEVTIRVALHQEPSVEQTG